MTDIAGWQVSWASSSLPRASPEQSCTSPEARHCRPVAQEVSKIVGEMWQKTSLEDKAPYVEEVSHLQRSLFINPAPSLHDHVQLGLSITGTGRVRC